MADPRPRRPATNPHARLPLFSFLSPKDHMALQRAPRLPASPIPDVVGKARNSPNTALGYMYGRAGHIAGLVQHAIDPATPRPTIEQRDGRTAFLNNPGAGKGALTLGEVTVYSDDPWSTKGRGAWKGTEDREKHPLWEHEAQHVRQGRQLGPAYLPSNIVGGLTALMFDRTDEGRPDWHGPHNWNEVGPQRNPARPWPWSRP